MNVSIDNTGPLERRVTVDVPEERIATAVQERLKKLSRTTRIDGFRPGKVPMKVVEQRFGTMVRQEVVGEVMQQTFGEAVSAENLRPATQPEIEPAAAGAGSGLTYTATFEVYPEISLSCIESMSVERPLCEIVDEDVDAMIENLRSQRMVWRPVERPAQSGDQITMDFDGLIDDTPFEGGAQEDAVVELGGGQLIPGFEDGLLGASAGQSLELELKFPDEYHAETLAGKPAKFQVQVKSVAESELPVLDDEFYKGFGVEDGGLEAFRTELRGNMEREKEQRLKNLVKENVMGALFEGVDVELPKGLVSHEAEHQRNAMLNRMQGQGADPTMLEQLQPSLFEEDAKRRVSLGLIVSEIVQTANIVPDQNKVREIIESMAAGYEDPGAVVGWYYEEKGRLAEIESSVVEEASVQWVLQQVKSTEKAITFDDLMNPGQTEPAKESE
jgi:trigger factor